MQWLLVRTDGAPVFTGVVQVKVGGIEEAQGKTGLAHMFEHMAFKGTREIGTTDFAAEAEQLAAIRRLEARIAKATPEERQALEKELEGIAAEARKYAVSNELWRLFHKNGADELNAYTNKDLTGYYARLATNMLPLWAYLTAGMVGAPVLREFYQERSVVMEERRSSVDSNPHGKLYEALVGTAFDKSPYRWPTIGSMEDLRDLRLTDAESFYRNYYCPDRMVGVVAGGIDVGLARRAVTQSFGALPARRCLPLTPHESVEPPQSSPRKVIVPFRAEPRIMIAWHKPALPHRDDYVFDLLLPIFCDGTTSRLDRRLVQTERVARTVRCDSGSPGSRLDNLLVVDVEPMGAKTERVLELIEEEIRRLQTELVMPDELAKSRTQIEAEFLWGIATNEGLAQQLAYFQTVAGDWRYLVRHSAMIHGIGAEDLQRVARRYLLSTNRTVAELVKR